MHTCAGAMCISTDLIACSELLPCTVCFSSFYEVRSCFSISSSNESDQCFTFIAVLAMSKNDGKLFCSCHEGTVTGKVECALTPLGFSVVAFGRCNTRRST